MESDMFFSEGLPESKDQTQTALYYQYCEQAAERVGVDFIDFHSEMMKNQVRIHT